MSVLTIEDISDAALRILVTEVFLPGPETDQFDRAVRQGLLKEQRMRAAAGCNSDETLFRDPIVSLIYLPDMRLTDCFAVAGSLVNRIIKLDRAALGAGISGDRSAHEELVSCVDFLVKVWKQIFEDSLREIAREKRRVQ